MKVFDFTVKKGDTTEEVFFQLLINNVAVDLTGVVIKADFKKSANDTVAYTMSTENDKIVITNAPEGRFKMIKQLIDIRADKYVYDMQFSFQDSSEKTYIRGTMTVEQDITIKIVS